MLEFDEKVVTLWRKGDIKGCLYRESGEIQMIYG